MSAKPDTCAKCQHINKTHKPMLNQGYARCNLLEKWQFVAPAHTCPKFKPKETKAKK